MRIFVNRCVGSISFWVLVGFIVTSPLWYWSILNTLGPSTEYHDPFIEGATKLPDGKYEAFVGDLIYVRYTVVRHRINGDCLLHVSRYGEVIGGISNGRKYLLDYAELRFRGANELLRPRWPLTGLRLGHAVTKAGVVKLEEPLLPPGRAQREFALYVVARYFCNPLDYVIPRYLQGGIRPNETERVILVLRRKP